MGRKIKLSLTVDQDDGSISFVDVEGCTHYMCDEPKDERQRCLDMRVQDFIGDYLNYRRSAIDGMNGMELPQHNHHYVVRIRDKYYYSICDFVDELRDAVFFDYSRAVYVRESLIQDHDSVEDAIGFEFEDSEIKIEPYVRPAILHSLELTYMEIALQLCKGLHKSDEELRQAEKWLTEYGTANDLSLHELNEMCWADSVWFFDQIFG